MVAGWTTVRTLRAAIFLHFALSPSVCGNWFIFPILFAFVGGFNQIETPGDLIDLRTRSTRKIVVRTRSGHPNRSAFASIFGDFGKKERVRVESWVSRLLCSLTDPDKPCDPILGIAVWGRNLLMGFFLS